MKIEIAVKHHIKYCNVISETIKSSAKVRGTGIALRTPEYIQTKIENNNAVIATVNKKFAGFCYIEIWGHGKYVAHSGLIVHPDFRGLGLAKKIKKLINRKISIKVIMGTWCSDSRDNVPGFFKLMDYLKFSERRIELIGLDVDKKNPNEDELKYDIINIPTFIFYKNGEEINRIVELTIESIEKDILKILDGSGYENAYYGF